MPQHVRLDALLWSCQIAKATRGRDLLLNVPFPRKPPDLLMAESPPKGGLSALRGADARQRTAGWSSRCRMTASIEEAPAFAAW
jgi:hypothetical protein